MFEEEALPNNGANHKMREAYRDVLLEGGATPAKCKKVFCDLIAQCCVFDTVVSSGDTAERIDAKREIGMHIMAMLGMAPSDREDQVTAMSNLVRVFAKNIASTKNEEGGKQ